MTATALDADLEPAFTGSALVLPRVNLLPPEIEERRRFRQIQAGLGGAVLAAVGVVGLLYVGASGSVSDARVELDDATATGAALRADAAQYANVTAVYDRAAAAQQTLTRAMGPEVRWSRYLNDLSFTVPDTVWVRSLTFSQTADAAAAPAAAPTAPAGTAPAGQPAAGQPAPAATPLGSVSFTGVGFSHDDVAVWLESLAEQKGYADPTFSNSTEALIGERKVVNFTSTATLTSDALSKRYSAPSGG